MQNYFFKGNSACLQLDLKPVVLAPILIGTDNIVLTTVNIGNSFSFSKDVLVYLQT